MLLVDGVYMFRRNGQWIAFLADDPTLTFPEIQKIQSYYIDLIHSIFHILER
jgi:hypothetical protein